MPRNDTQEIDFTADILDVRDLIARVEALEDERDGYDTPEEGDAIHTEKAWAADFPEEAAELATLTQALATLKGMGGDENWRGAWYPVTLVADDYFDERFAEEEAESCGLINSDARWPNNHIDWKAAAEELKNDYASVELDGHTFWVR